MKVFQRWLLILKSTLRSNAPLRCLGAAVHGMQAVMKFGGSAAGAVAKIEHLCSAVRLLPDGELTQHIEKKLLAIRDTKEFRRDEWSVALLNAANRTLPLLQKAVILKPKVSDNEPGVIFVSFEHQWAQLLRAPEVERLARDYTLVVSPTWSPPHSALNVLFPKLWPEPVHCLISHLDDLSTLPRLSDNYRMVPLLASNWVNEKSFEPCSERERDIDLVMVANFAPFKRHVRLFQTLRKLPLGLRILLIGQREGRRDAESVLREADAHNVRNRFELHSSMPHAEVLRCLCRAKASVVLSQREGSCVVVAESLFADTPVGLVEGAHIGSAKFIHPETGLFLREHRLADDILTLISARQNGLQPRAWAMQNNIGASGSSEILNAHLKADALASGRAWTRNIAAMHWCPNPRRMYPEECAWANEERDYIRLNHGILIGPDVP